MKRKDISERRLKKIRKKARRREERLSREANNIDEPITPEKLEELRKDMKRLHGLSREEVIKKANNRKKLSSKLRLQRRQDNLSILATETKNMCVSGHLKKLEGMIDRTKMLVAKFKSQNADVTKLQTQLTEMRKDYLKTVRNELKRLLSTIGPNNLIEMAKKNEFFKRNGLIVGISQSGMSMFKLGTVGLGSNRRIPIPFFTRVSVAKKYLVAFCDLLTQHVEEETVEIFEQNMSQFKM